MTTRVRKTVSPAGTMIGVDASVYVGGVLLFCSDGIGGLLCCLVVRAGGSGWVRGVGAVGEACVVDVACAFDSGFVWWAS